MNSNFGDFKNEALTDTKDDYMEPFKYLEQISHKNRMIFNELLQYTSESFNKMNNQE